MAGNPNQDDGIIGGINITPMVDITLVLLIIFIVTAKIVVTPAVSLDLPHASQSEEVQVIFSVVLPAEGATLVNGEAVADDAVLVEKAKAALGADQEVRAVINADGAVPHRRVLHTLDLLKASGLVHVAFGALPEEAPR